MFWSGDLIHVNILLAIKAQEAGAWNKGPLKKPYTKTDEPIPAMDVQGYTPTVHTNDIKAVVSFDRLSQT